MKKAVSLKLYAAGLCAAVIAVTAVAIPPAEAQTRTTKKQYVYVTTRDGTVVRRARSRVTVAPRSFLDPGTEVRPGERKFTDYALPPGLQRVRHSGQQHGRLPPLAAAGALRPAGQQ